MKRHKLGFFKEVIVTFIIIFTLCFLLVQKVNAITLPGVHEPVQIFASSYLSALWAPNNVNDKNEVSAWSSIQYPTEDVSNANNGRGVFITYAFGSKKPTINYVAMIPRRIGGIAYGFPKSFEVWILSGGTWSKARVINNCPKPTEDDDILVFTLENGKVYYDVTHVSIRAYKLGPDDYGNFYFQLAELSAGYNPKLRLFKLKGHDETHNTRLTIHGAAGKRFNPELADIKHPTVSVTDLKIANALNWYMGHDIRNFENPDLWMVDGYYLDQFGVLRDSGKGKARNIYPQSVIAYDDDLGKYWIIYFGGWYGGYSDDESFGGRHQIARDKIFHALTKDFAKFSQGKLILEPGPRYEHLNNPHVVTRGDNLYMIATTGNKDDAVQGGFESRNPVLIGEALRKTSSYAENWYHYIQFDSPVPIEDKNPVTDDDVPYLIDSPYPTLFPERDKFDTFPHCNSLIPFVWSEPYFHAYYMDEDELVREFKGSRNGPETIGVVNPGNAFDGTHLTHATIPLYWGEGGHYDFLHFVAYVGTVNTFVFNILVSHSYSNSEMIIDGKTSTGAWSQLDTISLNAEKFKTITLANAQDYVDAKGDINLRVRWINGHTGYDLNIKEIWSSKGSKVYHIMSKDLRKWERKNHYDKGLRYGNIMDLENLFIPFTSKPIMHLYRGFADVRFNMFSDFDDMEVEDDLGKVLFHTNPYSHKVEPLWQSPDALYRNPDPPDPHDPPIFDPRPVFSNAGTATIIQDSVERFMGTLWACSAAYGEDGETVYPLGTEYHRMGICATWYQKKFIFTSRFDERRGDIHNSYGYDTSFVYFYAKDRIETVSLNVFDGEDPNKKKSNADNAEYSIEKITIIGGDTYEYSNVINEMLFFEPIPRSLKTSIDANGCPQGFKGKFQFEAILLNLSGPPFNDLQIDVKTLTNENLLENADSGPAGKGATLTVPKKDAYHDGILDPCPPGFIGDCRELVVVPFSICLKDIAPFSFNVDVLGHAK